MYRSQCKDGDALRALARAGAPRSSRSAIIKLPSEIPHTGNGHDPVRGPQGPRTLATKVERAAPALKATDGRAASGRGQDQGGAVVPDRVVRQAEVTQQARTAETCRAPGGQVAGLC